MNQTKDRLLFESLIAPGPLDPELGSRLSKIFSSVDTAFGDYIEQLDDHIDDNEWGLSKEELEGLRKEREKMKRAWEDLEILEKVINDRY